MIIGIDGNEANLKTRVGVHQYAYELLKAFYKINKDKPSKDTFWIYLREEPIADLPQAGKYWKYIVLPGGSFWILRKLMLHLLKNEKPDIFFAPSHYLPPISSIPMVCTIHDLGYLDFSGQFNKKDFWQLKYWSAISLFVSKYIIAVSEATRNDIVRHYSFSSKKIRVVHHGYDSYRFNMNVSSNVVRHVKEKYKINGNYILFLSTLKPSKNIEGLVAAYKILVDLGIQEKLVIAGKKGWMFEEIFKQVEELKIKDRVVFTDYVDEDDKPGLVSGCSVFVSPSFWEGFGMHVLEAMACGKGVVVSRIASLPEVVGTAGYYINNPNDVREIAERIRYVLSMDKEEYAKLKVRITKQVSKFSWEKCATSTLEVFSNRFQENSDVYLRRQVTSGRTT